jgi:hypothetical protein
MLSMTVLIIIFSWSHRNLVRFVVVSRKFTGERIYLTVCIFSRHSFFIMIFQQEEIYVRSLYTKILVWNRPRYSGLHKIQDDRLHYIILRCLINSALPDYKLDEIDRIQIQYKVQALISFIHTGWSSTTTPRIWAMADSTHPPHR